MTLVTDISQWGSKGPCGCRFHVCPNKDKDLTDSALVLDRRACVPYHHLTPLQSHAGPQVKNHPVFPGVRITSSLGKERHFSG